MSKSRRDPPHYSYCIRVLLYVKDNTELPALGNSNYCKEQWTILSAVKTSIKHILFLKKIQRNIQHLPLQILTVITRVRSSMVTKSLKAPARQQTQCFSSTGEMSSKWEKLDCTGNVIFLLCI